MRDGDAVPMPRTENQGAENQHVQGALKERHGCGFGHVLVDALPERSAPLVDCQLERERGR